MASDQEVLEVFKAVVVAARTVAIRKLRVEFEAERQRPVAEERFSEREALTRFQRALLAARRTAGRTD